MAPSEQQTPAALVALLQDGKLAGSWTLDPARTEVLLETRHTWGLRPLRHDVELHRHRGDGQHDRGARRDRKSVV